MAKEDEAMSWTRKDVEVMEDMSFMMRHKHNGQWTHSNNEESFNSGEFFNTKEEAIEGGHEEYGESFFVGQVQSIHSLVSINAEGVLEDMSQNIYDHVGDVSQGYLSLGHEVSDEQLQWLEKSMNRVLHEWLVVTGNVPGFYQVTNIASVEGKEEI